MQPGQKPSPDAYNKTDCRLRACQVSVLLLLALHLVHGLYRRADPDEFQTLINAVNVSRGQRLYADFWDNHGPLMTWLLTPLLRAWTASYELLLWMRGLMWANTVALCILVYTFTKSLSRQRDDQPANNIIPWLAVIMLLITPPFMAKSIELRPDNPAILVGFGCLILLYHGITRNRLWQVFAAGLCLGVMAGLTLKAGMFAVALAAFGVAFSITSHRKLRVSEIGMFAAGAAILAMIITIALTARGILQPFLRCYLTENVQREFPGFTSSELTEILQKAPVWTCMALAVLGVSVGRIFQRKATAVEAGLCAMTLALLLQFALLLPTKYYQSLLPVYPPLAVLTSLTVERLGRERRWFQFSYAPAVATLIGLLLMRDLAGFNDLRNTALQRQIEFAEQATAILPDNANVFDPTGILYFAPRTGYYPILVKYVRRAHADGSMDAGIAAQLKNASAVVMDKRTKDLPSTDLNYIHQNFAPHLSGPGHDLWAPR